MCNLQPITKLRAGIELLFVGKTVFTVCDRGHFFVFILTKMENKSSKVKILPVKKSLTSSRSGVTKGGVVSATIGMAIASIPLGYKPALALPPASDIPEEVLRTEIILEARSPVDGKSLTAAEYAELQAQLQTRSTPPKLNPQVRDTIFLLRLRRTLRTFFPFLPI